MPAYRVDYPNCEPRMIEARSPRDARTHAAKRFTVSGALKARDIHDLTERGVDLEQAGNGES